MAVVAVFKRGCHIKCCHGDQIDWQGRLIRKRERETGGGRRAVHSMEQIGTKQGLAGCHKAGNLFSFFFFFGFGFTSQKINSYHSKSQQGATKH